MTHEQRQVVLDEGEVTDDLVCDMVEVLTGICARRSALNRAEKALRCAERNVDLRALSHPTGKMSW